MLLQHYAHLAGLPNQEKALWLSESNSKFCHTALTIPNHVSSTVTHFIIPLTSEHENSICSRNPILDPIKSEDTSYLPPKLASMRLSRPIWEQVNSRCYRCSRQRFISQQGVKFDSNHNVAHHSSYLFECKSREQTKNRQQMPFENSFESLAMEPIPSVFSSYPYCALYSNSSLIPSPQNEFQVLSETQNSSETPQSLKLLKPFSPERIISQLPSRPICMSLEQVYNPGLISRVDSNTIRPESRCSVAGFFPKQTQTYNCADSSAANVQTSFEEMQINNVSPPISQFEISEVESGTSSIEGTDCSLSTKCYEKSSSRFGKQRVRDPLKLKNRIWLQQNRKNEDILKAAGFRVIDGPIGRKHCSLCNARFSRKMFVWRHALSHLNEKPFHCSVCNQKFSRSDALQRHFLRVRHKRVGVARKQEF